ncbi:helix-turn-helix domain-containing protein, partial [Streptomyces clavuligerus]
MEELPSRPPSTGGAAEFVAALRRLKTTAGLTYRQLEQKAAAENRFVGRSTLANALTRDKLPSEAVVVALVRGCGYGEETAEEWLAVRCRIAAAPCAAEAAAQAGHGPEPPPESPVPHGPPAPDGHRRTGDGRGRN